MNRRQTIALGVSQLVGWGAASVDEAVNALQGFARVGAGVVAVDDLGACVVDLQHSGAAAKAQRADSSPAWTTQPIAPPAS